MRLTIPQGPEWEAIVRGALLPLCDPANFELAGSYSPEDTAAIFSDQILTTLEEWAECV